MGFGSGYSSRTDRGGKRYSNDMTAHVWASQSESRGQSGNGNFFFADATLFSYGSHFVVGYIMPDGLTFLNSDSYSISTSQHQGDARSAVRDKRTVHVGNLTKLADSFLPRLARYVKAGKPADDRQSIKDNARRALLAFAADLDSPILAPGESTWDYDTHGRKDMSGHDTAGAYLARLAGLPAATWPKLQRNAAKLAADKIAADAKAATVQAERRALQLADMPAAQWRNWIADMGTEYSAARMVSVGKDLKRARGLMLAAKRGKLASAGRLAIVRDRIKSLSVQIESFDVQRDRRSAAKALRHSVAIVRQWRDTSPAARLAVSWSTMRDVATCAERLERDGRLAGLKASAAELNRLAHIGMAAIAAENARIQRIEAERAKLAEAERVALWLAGERVGRVYFDAATGGAALRVVGDVLETSHGASVPLEHAVKAFRFIKLCRERGESFHRNGRTIRVGHFQVDSISASGDFKAGCHSFTWPEVERVAKLAGVFDCPASDAAIEPSAVAA